MDKSWKEYDRRSAQRFLYSARTPTQLDTITHITQKDACSTKYAVCTLPEFVLLQAALPVTTHERTGDAQWHS